LTRFFAFLSVVAQYCTFLTFGAALVIDTGVAQGLNPVLLGCTLVAVNMLIVVIILVVTVRRYRSERRDRRVAKSARAQTIEWAVGFSQVKFKTTLGS
jgi:uncharacterized membrane protein